MTTDELKAEAVRLYNEGMSTGDIGIQLGRSQQTISKHLRNAGIVLGQPRSSTSAKIAAANAARRSAEIHVCALPTCRRGFAPTRPSQQYCSRDCFGKSLAKDKPVCPCGTDTGSWSRKYCSPECRARYKSKPGRSPEAWVTFNCETCGDEVERSRQSGRIYRFCSNKCAKARGWFPGRKTVFDSRLEFRYACWLEVNGYAWRFYDGDDLQTPAGTYRPDFIVAYPAVGEHPARETVVEIKGRVTPEADEKLRWAQANVPHFIVLYEKDVERLFATLTGADAPTPF